MGINNKYTYEQIITHAHKYNCEILDTKEYVEKFKSLTKISIKSSCGHISMESINNFIKKKIGIYCSDCMGMIKNSKTQVKCFNPKCNELFVPDEKSFLFCCKFCSYSREQSTHTKKLIAKKIKQKIIESKQTYDRNIYSNGNLYLDSLIGNTFNFEITNRCCPYNHIIKPKNVNYTNDKIWMPIEIKYSNSSDDLYYYFTMRKIYNDMIILCVSLEDNKIWIFAPNSLEYVSKLKINKSSPNKFDIYNVDLTNQINIITILEKYYFDYKNILVGKNDNLEYKISDSNPHIKTEYEFKKKRINFVNFLNFENPISNFEPYNFKINGFKIQECVSFVNSKTQNQIVSIHKKVNGFSVPFDYQDNDFYWIHERLFNSFYLIPSQILYLNEYLNSEITKGKTTLNIDTNQSWLFEYVFCYDTIEQEENKQKLLNIFNLC